MTRWQPIETAPRDGTAILGGYFDQPWAESHREGEIAKCWFQPEFDAFISSCREMSLAAGYTFEGGATRQLHSPVIEAVTHWMPLPPSPDTHPKGGDAKQAPFMGSGNSSKTIPGGSHP
jgi:hypothetical protein